MNDSGEWATTWLSDLLGPNGSGMTRPVVVHDRQCAGLATTQLPEQLRELRRPIADGVPKNGRYAVVYERRWQGRDWVWLEAAEYAFGMFGARFLFAQPVRRGSSGALIPDGEPRELSEDDLAEPPAPVRGLTVRSVADAARAGTRRGLAASRRVRSLPRRFAGVPTAVIVAAWVGVLLLGVVSAVSLTELASSGRAAARARVAEHVAAHTAGQAAAHSQPAINAAAPQGASPPVHGSAPGDLGLAVPISRPACDGGYGVIVANATRPGDYRHEVGQFLARFSGASYLLAEQACSSLRAHTESGDSIYAVYYGPYPALGNACATRSRIGGGSYVRKLDNGPESHLIIKC